MAITKDDKLITLAGLNEFKTKYTEKFVGDFKLTKEGVETLVTAKEYVDEVVEKGGTGSVVTMIEEGTPTAGYLKSYSLYQGDNSKAENKIGTIDIPKDFVVKSGSIVTNPEGEEPGKYLALVINVASGTADDSTVYINVKDLCDVYTTGSEEGAQIVIFISPDNKISATLSDGSVTKAQLAEALAKEISDATTAIGVAKTEEAAGTGLTGRVEVLEASVSDITVATNTEIDGLFA